MSTKKDRKGFTLLELMISVAMVAIFTAFAITAYQSYMRRAYYSEIVRATSSYRVAVGECASELNTLTGCNAGTNGIPAAITTPQGAIESLAVANGVITVTPVEARGITASHTLILTPTLGANNTITWVKSGGGVTAGYVK